jgi:thymidylate synthase (FAD)
MHRVQPEVYLVGESAIDENEIERYLQDAYGEVGEDWYQKNVADQPSETSASELLTELMGRLCYRSFGVGEHNKNITKIREGNKEYIENILKSKHGSVCEHGTTHWIIKDVSRVFTHELVRHRIGMSPSQESLRYVRMDDFGLWLPEDQALTPEIEAACEEQFRADERFCAWLAGKLGLDDPGRNFEYKKKWTSFIRRFAPQGMATTIGITINFRSLRHVLAMRTAESAEVEIRYVFDKIAWIATERWPGLLQDFGKNDKGEWIPRHSKI